MDEIINTIILILQWLRCAIPTIRDRHLNILVRDKCNQGYFKLNPPQKMNMWKKNQWLQSCGECKECIGVSRFTWEAFRSMSFPVNLPFQLSWKLEGSCVLLISPVDSWSTLVIAQVPPGDKGSETRPPIRQVSWRQTSAINIHKDVSTC